MKKINYGRQFIDHHDIINVKKSLKENLLTTGKNVIKLENNIKSLFKVKYALSCINGTAALHLAFLSINIKKGDIILMPVVNFISAYRTANLLGAKIHLIDVDPHTGQMSLESLFSTIKKFNIKKIKAIVSMYLGGYPENIIQLYKLKKKYKFTLIEDACHAFGSTYKISKQKYYIGSCKHSDISVFSFHPVKTITTGEGGLLTTNNKRNYLEAEKYRSHGIIRNNKYYWNYDIKNLGFNYRLSDINCALGISQLNKLNKFILYRKKIYQLYSKKLKNLKEHITIPQYDKKGSSSFHLFIIIINFNKLKKNKKDFFIFMNENSVYPQFHYKPINRFSFYRPKNIKYEGASKYYRDAVSLPIYYGLKKSEINNIIILIRQFIWDNRVK